jgi:hypothetical protein
MPKKEHIIRVACTVEGHEDDWIEFDTSAWTLADWRAMVSVYYTDTITRWVEKDSVAWRLCNDQGEEVPHPGRGAEDKAWKDAYGKLGEAGFLLYDWLGLAPLVALHQRMTASKKSALGGTGTG